MLQTNLKPAQGRKIDQKIDLLGSGLGRFDCHKWMWPVQERKVAVRTLNYPARREEVVRNAMAVLAKLCALWSAIQ